MARRASSQLGLVALDRVSDGAAEQVGVGIALHEVVLRALVHHLHGGGLALLPADAR